MKDESDCDHDNLELVDSGLWDGEMYYDHYNCKDCPAELYHNFVPSHEYRPA